MKTENRNRIRDVAHCDATSRSGPAISGIPTCRYEFTVEGGNYVQRID